MEEEPAALNRTFGEYGLFPWDAAGWHTPLAYAVTRGREEIARLLVERGADVTVRSSAGQTLSEIARKGGHTEMAAMLDGAAERGEAG